MADDSTDSGGILGSLESDVGSAWNSISSAGAPAVIAGVENYAASQLTAQAQTNQAASQAAVNKAVASGGQASGIMQSIQSMFGSIAQGTVFKQYGLYIVVGVAVVLIVGRKIL